MKNEDIYNLPIQNITDENCLLFIWVTSPKLDIGLKTIEAWGFKYKTVAFVWDKMSHMPGNYTVSNCELCLVAKKGAIPKPRGARNEFQLVREKRTIHSKKPEEVRKRIERMFPMQNKIELFARIKADGWDCWGNEVESDIDLLKVS